jgi:hypothetical protein
LYSLFVLDKKHEWGYDDVSDYTMNYLLKDYREDAFKQIEAMAYSGNAYLDGMGVKKDLKKAVVMRWQKMCYKRYMNKRKFFIHCITSLLS